MLPVLLEEYRDAVHALRLRSAPPSRDGVLNWRRWAHLLYVGVRAFYPLIFDVAKRSRVTVEAMETRGFSRSLGDPDSRELRLADLGVTARDVAFSVGAALFVAGLLLLREAPILLAYR